MKQTIISLVAIAALAAGLHAQAPAAAPAGAAPQKSAKNWKDTAEYDLYSAIIKPDATPASRLQNLDKWKAGYPQSDYADTRQKIYLITYQALNNHRAAFDIAVEILKTDPNDLASIQEILGYIRALMPQDAKAPLSAQNKADLETAEKVARYLLANADAVFAADKKPQGATDAQWAQAKPTMEKFAQFTLGYIGVEQKDNAKAETELVKTLQTDPTNAQASYMLATLLLGEQKEHPDKMPFALFEYARSAVYDGPGALDAKTRGSVDNFLTTKAYTTYHGSAEGLPELKTLAKTNALPPGEGLQNQEHGGYRQGRGREAPSGGQRQSDAGLLDHDEGIANVRGCRGVGQILGSGERRRTSSEGERSHRQVQRQADFRHSGDATQRVAHCD